MIADELGRQADDFVGLVDLRSKIGQGSAWPYSRSARSATSHPVMLVKATQDGSGNQSYIVLTEQK